jgi:hypothetical protein
LWGGCKASDMAGILGPRALRWDGMALGIPVCPNRVRFGRFSWGVGAGIGIGNDMPAHFYNYGVPAVM